ncbi:MAG: RdgB/HAM1 family non-canonical purine NTP pyrophosphatase, partial [Planctomycetota bacterium]
DPPEERRMPSPPILLASNNSHKRAEILRLLGLREGTLLSPGEVANDPPTPAEDGQSYLENAVIKARAFSLWARLTALADDTGLEVSALGGRPGLRTARYAGPDAGDRANLDRLLEELAEVREDRRQARFVCVLALCRGEETLFEARGVCPGRITTAPRGGGGFGYDPIFVPEGETRTFAEMAESEKDRISHRGRALRLLSEALAAGRLPLRGGPGGR